jgi:DNA-3-methyladenine glycosylase
MPIAESTRGGRNTAHWNAGLPPLARAFYARDVLTVARDCIGKVLVSQTAAGVTAGRIVEAEAYRGPDDRAAHSFGGRRTARTEVMFGAPGHVYVFFVYGMHWHLNLVTGKIGDPHAVLLRAVEPLHGIELMAERRDMNPARRELTNGPGKLCQAFGIGRSVYGSDLCGPEAVYLAESPRPARVARSPRIGVDYAGEWAARPFRFFDPESPYVGKLRAPGAQHARLRQSRKGRAA